MHGAGVGAGQILDGAHIFDLAPTILERLGVEPPEHMTGRRLARGDDRSVREPRR